MVFCNTTWMYCKPILRLWWEDAFLSRKEGHKHRELRAWNSVTKHQMSRIEGWKGFAAVFSTSWSRHPLVATARTPDLQDLGPGCVYEDVTGTPELDMFNLGTIDLAFRRETTTNQAMPLSAVTGNLKIWVSARPQCKLMALRPKWTTVLAICPHDSFLTISALWFILFSTLKCLPLVLHLPKFGHFLNIFYPCIWCPVVICMLFLFAFLQIASPLEKKGLRIFARTCYHVWWSF